MPQASDELRKIVAWIIQPKLFTEVPDDGAVTDFLVQRGYTLNKDWTWKLPSKDHYVTEMEELCVRYMCDEWDYGWLEQIEQA